MALRNILVGVTGASGAPLAAAVLRELRAAPEVRVHLAATRDAELTLRHETGGTVEDLAGLADRVYAGDDLAAAVSSGSHPVDAMIVVPCSMKTAAGIACGFSDNLVLRAADVAIKEGRPLILVPRESPLSCIHLQNLLTLSRIPGVKIVPPMLNSYQGLATIAELEAQLAKRIVSYAGVACTGMKRWQGG